MKTLTAIQAQLTQNYGEPVEFPLDGKHHRFGHNKHIWAIGNSWEYKGNAYWAMAVGSFVLCHEGKAFEYYTSWENDDRLSVGERKSVGQYYHKIKQSVKEYRKLEQTNAARKFQLEWKQMDQLSDNHGYTIAKGVHALYGARICKGELIVPITNSNGELCGGQRIFKKDDKWEKRYVYGTETSGSYFAIGISDSRAPDEVFLCEGYVTGASVFEAIQKPVICSFQANNIPASAKTIRKLWPEARIVIAADNDSLKENTGEVYAKQACRETTNCVYHMVQIPHGLPGTDFNDLAQLPMGKDLIKAQLAQVNADSDAQWAELIKDGFTGWTESKPYRQYQQLLNYFIYKEKYRYVPKQKTFYCYENGYYKRKTDEEIKAFAQTYLYGLMKINEGNQFLSLCKCNKERHIEINFFESEECENYTNVANGLYSWKDKTLHPHNPNIPHLNQIKTEYDAHTECPVWDKLNKNLTCDKPHLQYSLEAFWGYVFSGMSMHKFNIALIMDGTGDNGKSTMIKIIREIIGQENISAIPMSEIPRDRFLLSGMYGRILNLSEEEPDSVFKKTGYFKLLTGDSPVTFQYKGGDPFSSINKTKIVISYNKTPALYDSSPGMKRRIMIIPFDLNLGLNPDKKIKDLMQKIRPEYPAILARCISHYGEIIDAGSFPPVPESIKILRTMEEKGDTVIDWRRSEECDFIFTGNPKDWSSIILIRHAYKEFCKENDRKPTGQIKSRLIEIARQENIKINYSQKLFNGKKVTGFSGIKSKI